MTRFAQELNGRCGAYWKANAEKELADLRTELDLGKITIDENGVARNRVGRILMSDMLERLTYITDKVNVEATTAARDEEVERDLADYRKNHRTSAEERREMRAAFGTGATVVNVISGERIRL